jgi:tRNA modification GTPase
MRGDAARTDTIFAPATARGRAGVGVIRVSGTRAGAVLAEMAGILPEPRQARLARIVDPAAAELIDRGLVLWFPAPASFTGEDVAEFHIHGGPAVMAAMLAALRGFDGCRLAEPGEFSRRAFEHGKLDLTGVEAIGDLVAAETAAQRRQALRQMGGEFARLTEGWAGRLLRGLARLEAALDFPDEDLPSGLLSEVAADAASLADEIRARLGDRRGEIVRDGLSVAIIGPPNSGKSSLLNALAGREAAIVSAIAGTTRDVIEVQLDLGGYPIILADTAGIRESVDPIEAEGVRRARQRAESADMCLILFDICEDVSRETVAALLPASSVVPALVVRSKCDLMPAGVGEIGISVKSGAGIDALIARLGEQAEALLDGPAPLVTRHRHRVALEDCLAALDRSFAAIEPALMAEDLRLAMRALGRITGKVDVEDLLDVIFREFCIGK